MICVELSNAACRVSLRGPGAELEGEGGVQTPPARRGWRRAPARRGLTIDLHTETNLYLSSQADSLLEGKLARLLTGTTHNSPESPESLRRG